jgi:HlyD family secretion protein
MRLKKRYLLVILIVIVLISIGYTFYRNRNSSGAESDTPQFKEYPVKRGTFEVVVNASGIVQPIDRIEIKSKASGRVEELPVEEGDFVEKGALLCRLDQTDVQAELDQARADQDIARAELKQAQNTYDRQDKLYNKGLISEEEKDQADLLLAQAKGKMVRAQTVLARAEIQFSETIVRAPIDGVILQKYVEEGQIIASGISNVGGGTPIVDIADMRAVYIEAGIDEIDVGKIRIGQEAVIIAEAYPQESFRGNIIRIAPEAKIEQNVTLFDVVVEVANDEGKLKSGMNVTGEITIAREENVLLAPSTALGLPEGLQEAEPDIRMTMLKRGDRFIPHTIRVGPSNFRETIVIDGLEEGDILGVPMVSRLKAENDRLAERIRSSRGFGVGSSRSSRD